MEFQRTGEVIWKISSKKFYWGKPHVLACDFGLPANAVARDDGSRDMSQWVRVTGGCKGDR